MEKESAGRGGRVKRRGVLGVQRMDLSAASDPSWLERGRGHSEAISGGQEHNADSQGMRGRCTERQLWDGPKTGGGTLQDGGDRSVVGGRIWGSARLETPIAASCGANRVCKEVWGASRSRR